MPDACLRAPMLAKTLTVGLALFVIVDFSNPFVGGAFTFNADESVEGLRSWKAVPTLPAPASVPLPVAEEMPAVRAARPVPPARRLALSRWLVEARRASSSVSPSPPGLGEDH